VRLALTLDDAAPRYDVLRELGRGGMGEVQLCFDRRIGRQVALKRSTTAAALEAGSDRFLREICVQGQLEHPTIVPLHDLGVGTDGQVYFTMKRVRGRTLKNILAALRQGDEKTHEQFPLRKLLGALANVCLGVAFAHSRGVIHRDLKPDNLMLGEFGEVYVLDWGVAKVVSMGDHDGEPVHVPEPSTSAGGTAAGSLIGTPGYMSPEQCTATTDRIDERTDVYALGAILFEVLAGTPLHVGSALDKIHTTVEGVDARVHVRAPERDAPPELDAVCVKATALEPARRLGSARELSDEIERSLSHDRNVELRRDLAAEHARAASGAADRALGAASGAAGAPLDRRRGLAEAGRALALDPGNEEAMRVMLRLLTEPPREIPAEVLEEEKADAQKRRREAARGGSIAFVPFLLLIPLNALLGVASWPWFAAYVVSSAAFVALLLYLRRVEHPGEGHVLLSMSFASVPLYMMAAATGPLLVAPGFAALGLFGNLLLLERYRAVGVAIGSSPVVVPLFLQWVGVLPPSYAFSEAGMTILPRVFLFHAVPTLVVLAVSAVAVLALAVLAGVYIRRSVADAERSLKVQAWQLRQLVPASPRST